jgi:uncharacterized membrane protein YphA (DoxX/SURF4 family)
MIAFLIVGYATLCTPSAILMGLAAGAATCMMMVTTTTTAAATTTPANPTNTRRRGDFWQMRMVQMLLDIVNITNIRRLDLCIYVTTITITFKECI